MPVRCLLIVPAKMVFPKIFVFFHEFVKAESIKLAKMAGVMHEADHAYSIRSTWWLHWLASDVPSIACVINSQSIFVCNLDLSNFLLESGLWCFLFLSVCLLLVYFVSAAGCHCFDLNYFDKSLLLQNALFLEFSERFSVHHWIGYMVSFQDVDVCKLLHETKRFGFDNS